MSDGLKISEHIYSHTLFGDKCEFSGLGALTEFCAADFGDGLAGLAGRFVVQHAKLRVARAEHFAELIENVFGHGVSRRKRKETVKRETVRFFRSRGV